MLHLLLLAILCVGSKCVGKVSAAGTAKFFSFSPSLGEHFSVTARSHPPPPTSCVCVCVCMCVTTSHTWSIVCGSVLALSIQYGERREGGRDHTVSNFRPPTPTHTPPQPAVRFWVWNAEKIWTVKLLWDERKEKLGQGYWTKTCQGNENFFLSSRGAGWEDAL